MRSIVQPLGEGFRRRQEPLGERFGDVRRGGVCDCGRLLGWSAFEGNFPCNCGDGGRGDLSGARGCPVTMFDLLM